MKTATTDNITPFLAGGGEMGELIQRLDWSSSPLGAPATWPLSLRTTLGLLLHSTFPMFLVWGREELLCFYNDAYRPSLGNNGVHPAIGKSYHKVWPEVWGFVGPLFKKVMDTGEAVYFEDQLVPFERDGKLDDAWWTFCYGPAYDDNGAINGILVTCSETTKTILSRQQIEESHDELAFAIEAAELAIFDLNPQTNTFKSNARLKEWFGLQPEMEINLELAVDIIAERDRDRVAETIAKALRYESGGRYDTEYTIINPVNGQERVLRAKGKVQFDQNQVATQFSGTLQDITQQVLSRQIIEESEARFRALIEEAPVATCLFVGPEMRVEFVNSMMVTAWGKDFTVKNKPLIDALPELRGQPFLDILANVYTTGITYEAKAAPVDLVIDGVLDTYYYDFTYKPLKNEKGEVWAIINVSINVTERILAARKLAESETKLRGIISSAPAGIGLFVGRDLIIENPNQTFIDIVGKGPDIVGLPLREAMPELITEGQPFLQILDDVFTTGIQFQSPGTQVKIVQNGVMTYNYYNITYTPVFDPEGKVYAILDIAIDVTEQIKAQKALEEAELELRSAIELAELGTWTVNVATGIATLSPRHATWLGLEGSDHPIAAVMACISEQDRERIDKALFSTVQPGAAITYDEEYTVVNAHDGKQLIMHAIGQAYFDKDGQPVRIAGTAQDVTTQRDLVLALANQVQLRTEELALTNNELAETIEELAATNEEMAATNEEITSSNEEYIAVNEELNTTVGLLNRSNENLQRFAYVASHDLQEPLRKIQQFGDLLKTEHAAALGDELVYLERMQDAASRMSTLIRDLLSYSRISAQSEVREPVSLNQVVDQVLTDLELVIEETSAQISVGTLPTVIGDASQLGQLFQNLLSNALKFRRPGIAPVIQVNAHITLHTDLPANVKPIRTAQFYHHLEVIDNGIGFDEQYTQRIFEVFQRLHRKHEYAGTGIGLSISERVVTNHGGAISASSQPGQGATFSVYLPV